MLLGLHSRAGFERQKVVNLLAVLPHDRHLAFMGGLVEATRASCLFLADSGEEDALA